MNPIYTLSKASINNRKQQLQLKEFGKHTFFLFVSFFVIVGALLVVSIIDADLVQAFSDMYHIDDVVSGGIIMAVATGLPEFVSNFYLFKRQHFNMIFESIVGSL